MSGHTSRRDRGVALPSPVAAISIVAIVVAAIAFAVTGFGGSKTKVIPNAAPTHSSTHASTSATSTATSTVTLPPSSTPTVAPINKTAIHVSVWNASTTPGLAKDVLVKVKAAGWTNSASGTTHVHYSANTIYYPAKYAAAAKQLGLDLGITNLSQGDSATPQDRISVVLVSPLS
ncbi:hypothetical protein Back2_13050 [Nocardioides baekrokdamisoli]|uniref:LytR/CpsA/Psr regulator C-terminal domain-containing protein n=1 Tax=Nocardioides baekrokdamisoli TaxID=1804624 RepID=A0A3G9J057_9ACTN|nr:LytR C-terminal domain-containing protein [Nocardioides baekrokdamisoli]BBH17018.1 hypothetical protein Back2_13050 [Nocardioides baekrokdamisoli]